MNKIRVAITVALCAFAVTFAIADSSDAKAAFRRVHSSQCHTIYDNSPDLWNAGYIATSTTARSIYCPAPSDSTLTHNGTVTLNVHGFEAANQSAYSYACVKYYNALGSSCDLDAQWASGYGGAIGLSVSVWNSNGQGMPYVYTWLPPSSHLYGFYMSN